MGAELKNHVTRKTTWLRGLFMLIFALFYSVAEFVLAVVAIFQFLVLLFTGAPNARLLTFGRQLSVYVYHVFLFLTFNRDDKPFPFAPWPDGTDASREPPASLL